MSRLQIGKNDKTKEKKKAKINNNKKVKTNKTTRQKEKKPENTKKDMVSIFLKSIDRSDLYYSGFCLTDNVSFAFFYADTKIIVDKIDTNGLNRFKFNESDLDMLVNKEVQLEPKKKGKEFVFDIGSIDCNVFNAMIALYPECVFHPIKEFNGNAVNSMIIVLQEEYGKPIGLFKTH
jgi:hypothetical protein